MILSVLGAIFGGSVGSIHLVTADSGQFPTQISDTFDGEVPRLDHLQIVLPQQGTALPSFNCVDKLVLSTTFTAYATSARVTSGAGGGQQRELGCLVTVYLEHTPDRHRPSTSKMTSLLKKVY